MGAARARPPKWGCVGQRPPGVQAQRGPVAMGDTELFLLICQVHDLFGFSLCFYALRNLQPSFVIQYIETNVSTVKV